MKSISYITPPPSLVQYEMSLKLSGLLALLLAASVTLTACGGGGSNIVPSLGEASQNPTSQANIAAAAAAEPKEGSVTQSSNTEGVDNPTTTDSVAVEVTYSSGSGQLEYAVREAVDAGAAGIGRVTINSTDDVVRHRDTDDKFAEVDLYKKLPDGQLWVDIYTDNTPDISTPDISSDGEDVPTNSMVQDMGSNVQSPGGVSGLTGNFNDQVGTFSCPSGCTIAGGRTTAGTWTFTPSAARGVSVPVGSVLGSDEIEIDGRLAYSGNFNGQAGIFSCSFLESTTCGIANGRTAAGTWTFTSISESVVVTQDTDYLAGGIWIYVPDDADSVEEYEFGAFFDGNDKFTQANLAGLTGTAVYTSVEAGQAPDSEGVAGGFADAGESFLFYADVELTASFGTNSELGTISGRIFNVIDQVDEVSIEGNPVLTLNEAMPETGSSLFTGDTSMTFREETYAGKWGAQFYGNGAAATDHPGSVAGTFGAATPEGADRKSLLGVFGAFKQ